MGLWEEDILAYQPRRAHNSVEQRLALAILEDALRLAVKPAVNRKAELESIDAQEWLQDDTWDHPYSFRSICDELGLDPSNIRGKVLRQLAAGEPPVQRRHRR